MTTHRLRLPTSESDALNILGYGIEIVETSRIKELIENLGKRFEIECFTNVERSASDVINRIHYFAGRFAAKEAVLKVLDTGSSLGISWLDIEVQRLPTGEPSVVLHSKCKEIAAALGITKWLLSISHVSSYAAASVIALGASSRQLSPHHY